MTGYIRQSSADIVTGAVVKAAPINAEFDRLKTAFDNPGTSSSGHRHDNSTGEGGYVPLISDIDNKNQVATNASSNTIDMYVEVGGVSVQQLALADGVLKPVTDNDIALGTTSLGWSDVYIADDGMVRFRDAAIFIKSDADGKLNITADAEVEINATAIDLNGAVDATTLVVGALTYPAVDGTAGQVLTTNGSGTISFSAAGAASAAGTDTQVQFNDGGNLGGDSGLVFNKSTDALTIAGTLSSAAGTLPNGHGTNGQVLTTNGSGTTSWSTISSGTATITISDDNSTNSELPLVFAAATGTTTNTLYARTGTGSQPITLNPSQQRITGNNLVFNSLSSHSGSDLTLTQSGTGDIILNNGAAIKWPTADGSNGQAITTDGSGNLAFSTISGGGGGGSSNIGHPKNGLILSLSGTKGEAQQKQVTGANGYKYWSNSFAINANGSSTLYAVPAEGNSATICIGGVDRTVTFGAIPTITESANKGFACVFAYWTGSAVALESYTGGSAPMIEFDTTNDVWVKDGDDSRTLVGYYFYATSTSTGSTPAFHYSPFGDTHNTNVVNGQRAASINFASAYNAHGVTLQKSNMMWGNSPGDNTSKTTGRPILTDWLAGTTPGAASEYSWHEITGNHTSAVPVFSPTNAGGTDDAFNGRINYIEPNALMYPETEIQCDIYWYMTTASATEEAWFELRSKTKEFGTGSGDVPQPGDTLDEFLTDVPSYLSGHGGLQTSTTSDELKFTSLRYTMPRSLRTLGASATTYSVGVAGGTRKTIGLYAGVHGTSTLKILGYTLTVKTHM